MSHVSQDVGIASFPHGCSTQHVAVNSLNATICGGVENGLKCELPWTGSQVLESVGLTVQPIQLSVAPIVVPYGMECGVHEEGNTLNHESR